MSALAVDLGSVLAADLPDGGKGADCLAFCRVDCVFESLFFSSSWLPLSNWTFPLRRLFERFLRFDFFWMLADLFSLTSCRSSLSLVEAAALAAGGFSSYGNSAHAYSLNQSLLFGFLNLIQAGRLAALYRMSDV